MQRILLQDNFNHLLGSQAWWYADIFIHHEGCVSVWMDPIACQKIVCDLHHYRIEHQVDEDVRAGGFIEGVWHPFITAGKESNSPYSLTDSAVDSIKRFAVQMGWMFR